MGWWPWMWWLTEILWLLADLPQGGDAEYTNTNTNTNTNTKTNTNTDRLYFRHCFCSIFPLYINPNQGKKSATNKGPKICCLSDTLSFSYLRSSILPVRQNSDHLITIHIPLSRHFLLNQNHTTWPTTEESETKYVIYFAFHLILTEERSMDVRTVRLEGRVSILGRSGYFWESN